MSAIKKCEDLRGLGWKFHKYGLCPHCQNDFEWWYKSRSAEPGTLHVFEMMPKPASPVVEHVLVRCGRVQQGLTQRGTEPKRPTSQRYSERVQR